jgi:sodium-dependent dicarboxylate transporter 2/3/5
VKRGIAFGLGWVLFLLVLSVPTPAGMSGSAQRVAATVALMSVWWIGEALPLAATALVPLVLFPALGVTGVKQVASSYAEHLIFLFLGGFLIATAIQRWGLHRRIALWVLRAVGTQPARVVLGFMLATAALSMWISNTATAMMMYPIAMAVVDELSGTLPSELQPEERDRIHKSFGLVVMLAVAYSASIGGVGTLIGTPPNVVLAGQYATLFPEAPPLTFLSWMLLALPVVALMLPVAWLYLVHFAAPVRIREVARQLRPERLAQRDLTPDSKLRGPELHVLVVFVLTALLWVFRADIDLGSVRVPGWSRWLPNPGFVTDASVAIAMGLVLFAIPVDRKFNRFVLDWSAAKDLPWGVLLLFGGGFAIARGMADSGLSNWIGDRLGGLQSVPAPVVVLICCVVVMLLTEVTSNTAVAAMMLPIVASLAGRLDVPPLLVMFPTTLAASFAFVLPVATPPNAIVMGSGWVTIPQMARTGLMLDLIGLVIIVGVSLGLGPLLL